MAERGKLAWRDAQALAEAVSEYFAGLTTWTDEHVVRGAGEEREEFTRRVILIEKPPTMAGLALHLGVTRMTLFNYSTKDEFLPVIARAKTMIAEYAETRLYDRHGSNGARFALEVNHGYGKEDEQAGGEGDEPFEMKVIQPGGEAAKAIPKFEEE